LNEPANYDRTEQPDDVQEIRRDIERTQTDLGGTIEAIQEKLSPGALIDEARGPVEDTADHIVAEVQKAFRESVDHLVSEARGPVEEMGDHLISRATNAIEEATDHILERARATATETASSIVEQTGHAVRAATIGKVEKMATRVSQAGDSANEMSKGFGSSVIATVRANPLPASLAALGLGWLYLKRSNASSGTTYGQPYQNGQVGSNLQATNAMNKAASALGDGVSSGAAAVGDAVGSMSSTVGETAAGVGEAVTGVVSMVGDTAGQVASGTQGAARNMVTEAQFQVLRVSEGLQTVAQKNPLALGAAGIALGSLIGLAIPQSQAEHRLMGGVRDAAVDQAGETAQGALQKAGHVAEKVGDVAEAVKA
jgi:hypothetical protein